MQNERKQNSEGNRLYFTKKELPNPTLTKLKHRAQRTEASLNTAEEHIPQNPANTPKRTASKKAVRLRFEYAEQKRPSKLTHIVTDAPTAMLHREIQQNADENVGVEAVHRSEQAAETVYRIGDNVPRRVSPSTNHNNNRQKPSEASSRSRLQQRRAIKRQYIASKSTESTAKEAGKATITIVDKAKKAIETFAKGNKAWLIVGGMGLLIMMMTNGISSCGNFGMGGMQAILSTSYVSEDRDILQVDKQYTRIEDQLDRRMDNMEFTYPGYDEYRYDVDEIGHNPYVLMSYLTAKHVSFTLRDVQDELTALFEQQYRLNLVETIEIRYRTEQQPTPTIDPMTGRETTVIKDVEVPYEYKILSIELRNYGLSAVIAGTLDEEQQELYQVLMEIRGNKPELFASDNDPFVGEPDFTAPEPYEFPPEALSDPKFAALIAEANKYLGYPYVWGGSKPSTSFDCSGFTCWVLNQSGAASVGRTNARGLYKKSTVVSASNARPGDLVFFTGTRATEIGHPVTHVGIYVGNGMMIHCAGNGVEYKSITGSKYYRTHLYAYGRLS